MYWYYLNFMADIGNIETDERPKDKIIIDILYWTLYFIPLLKKA